MELDKYPDDRDSASMWAGLLACPLSNVKSNFERFGVLDDKTIFVKGFFKDTMPNATVKQIAVLRVDADLFSSTIQALEFLYPKLSPGGYVVFDDWKFEPVQRAIEQFRSVNKITAPLQFGDTVDPIPFWQKI